MYMYMITMAPGECVREVSRGHLRRESLLYFRKMIPMFVLHTAVVIYARVLHTIHHGGQIFLFFFFLYFLRRKRYGFFFGFHDVFANAARRNINFKYSNVEYFFFFFIVPHNRYATSSTLYTKITITRCRYLNVRVCDVERKNSDNFRYF